MNYHGQFLLGRTPKEKNGLLRTFRELIPCERGSALVETDTIDENYLGKKINEK